MAFTITARLPLGTYRGAHEDGRAEALPSVSRLYSALLCAAGLGPRAVCVPDGLELDPRDEQALRWLEDNPPDAVRIPPLQVNAGRAIAYRDDGTLSKSKQAMTTKKLAKQPDGSVAVGGDFAWTWSQDPPPEVIDSLGVLCGDVPYLGTTESPVRLTARRSAGDDRDVTHRLDRDASLFGAPGEDIGVPVRGRLQELTAAHRAASGRPPSAARDKIGTDEKSTSPVPTRDAVAPARYVPVRPDVRDVPWSQALLVPIDRPVDERDRVRWAVALHRALIRVIGDGAPPLITGVYPPGTGRPANRLAVQFVDATMPLDLPAGAPAGIALMIPGDVPAGDLTVLTDAVDDLRVLYGPRGSTDVVRVMSAAVTEVAGDRFWRPRPPDTVRLWATCPPAVPDVRGVRGAEWTFAHTALLSLGFVLKDRLDPVPGRRDTFYRNMVTAVLTAGAAVLDARPERTTVVRDYAHTVNDHAVVRPYRALMSLPDLLPDRAVLALGQSRHLGGGLLVPTDVPEGTPLRDAVLSSGPRSAR